MRYYSIAIAGLLFVLHAFGAEKPDEAGIKGTKVAPPTIGNLSLSSSQTPGPLFSFGHILVDKGDKLLYTYGNQLRGCNKKANELLPFALFGITDTISLLVAVPAELRLKEDGLKSSGIGDITAELEMGFYSKVTESVWRYGSFVFDFSVPTGSDTKIPATGFGSPTFLTGITFDQTGVDWYFLTSQGILWTTKHRGIKYGNEYFYQFGVGKNISYKADTWIFSALVELLGGVAGRTVENCIPDPNTGGNIIFLAPSLWFSTQRLTLQVGIAGAILQDLNGIQNKDRFIFTAGAGWKF